MDGIYIIVSAIIGASATIASVLISRKRAKDIARKKPLQKSIEGLILY